MKKVRCKLIIAAALTFSFCFFIFIFDQSVFAITKDPFGQGLQKTGDNAGYTVVNDPSHTLYKNIILNNVGYIFRYGFLSITGVVYLVLMIYAGFTWMKARGNEADVTKAKDIIINATVGLIVLSAAYAISYFVISTLQSVTLTPS